MFMSGKLLLFSFEELPTILAAAAAAGPFGAEVVPVARQDYNKPLAVLAGLDDDPGTLLPFTGGPLGAGWWYSAAWRIRWTPCCRRCVRRASARTV